PHTWRPSPRPPGYAACFLRPARQCPGRFHERYSPGLRDGGAGHSVCQLPGQQVLQPALHLVAGPAHPRHPLRHQGVAQTGLPPDQGRPRLFRRVRSLWGLRPPVRRRPTQAQDCGCASPLPPALGRRHQGADPQARLAAGGHVRGRVPEIPAGSWQDSLRPVAASRLAASAGAFVTWWMESVKRLPRRPGSVYIPDHGVVPKTDDDDPIDFYYKPLTGYRYRKRLPMTAPLRGPSTYPP